MSFLLFSVSYRKTDIGFLFEGKVVMPRHLRNSTGFAYKYIVHKTTSKSGKLKVIWELVQRRVEGKDPAVVNRQFSMPSDKKASAGLWDFVLNPHEKYM